MRWTPRLLYGGAHPIAVASALFARDHCHAPSRAQRTHPCCPLTSPPAYDAPELTVHWPAFRLETAAYLRRTGPETRAWVLKSIGNKGNSLVRLRLAGAFPRSRGLRKPGEVRSRFLALPGQQGSHIPSGVGGYRVPAGREVATPHPFGTLGLWQVFHSWSREQEELPRNYRGITEVCWLRIHAGPRRDIPG